VQPVIEQLQKFGETRRGWLGVRIQNIDDAIAENLNLGSVRGALIAGVDEKGPAKPAGLKTGDVIVKFDGRDVKESRDLPKLVAATPVGKDVDVTVVREGKEVVKIVKLGRLEDGEKQASLETSKTDATKEAGTGPVQKALGLEFSGLNDELRKKYSIRESVKSGVVVTSVEPRSNAADKRIQPGEVIVEINQEPVAQPADVTKKLRALKDSGKKSALLLVAGLQGDVHFVALPIE
jgi:serine protease Do